MEATALVTLSFILFLSFTKNGVSASRDISITVDHRPDGDTPVLDSAGNEVTSDQYYYLQPYLLSFPYENAIVPVIIRDGVVWILFETKYYTYNITGLPVNFSPVPSSNKRPGGETIYESEDLHIKYRDLSSPLFGGSSLWKLEDGFPHLVSLGGAEENSSSSFKIEKARDDHVYKLVSTFLSKDIATRKTRVGGEYLGEPSNGDTTFEFRLLPERGEASASK